MKAKRRDFLKKLGLLTGGAMIFPRFPLPDSFASASARDSLPKGSFIIKNAEIITMDEKIETLQNASISVSNGEIKEIGKQVSAIEGAEIIDGSKAVVMPGLIDCHWHLWTSLMRSMAGDKKEKGYFPMTAAFSRVFTSKEMKLAVRYATAEAINAGITTISDFNHNAQTPDFVLASCNALAEAGMRAEVQYGGYRDQKKQEPTPFQGIKEVLSEIDKNDKYKLIRLGLGSRGVNYKPLTEDWRKARELEMRITIHASSNAKQLGQIGRLQEMNLLGPDVNIIHANFITDPEIEAVKAAGSSVTMTPYSEMRIGYGFPPVKKLHTAHINTSLGVDSTALTGSADLFEIMKLVLNLANAEAESEFFLPHHEVLKMATINAAKTLGIDKITGSLKPGKRADLIMLRKDDLNFSSGIKTKNLIVEAGAPKNVELVCVDGVFLKKEGQLTRLNAAEIIEEAAEATKRLAREADY